MSPWLSDFLQSIDDWSMTKKKKKSSRIVLLDFHFFLIINQSS